MKQYDAIVIGAGAAGLFCASLIGKGGKQVLVLDGGKKAGRKILMSGGGYCNFTNLDISAKNYLSANPHFVKSALARYTQWDFIALVEKYGIRYHEKEQGQLFTDEGSEKIVAMLLAECQKSAVEICLRSNVIKIEQLNNIFTLTTEQGIEYQASNIVIATGGLSMPALGVTPFGYQIAEQFGLSVIPPRASLVPFTFKEKEQYLKQLAGVALKTTVTAECGQSFTDQLLFTHRGLSGPAILQISNYWQAGEVVTINFLPDLNIKTYLTDLRQKSAKLQLNTALSHHLPKNFVDLWLTNFEWKTVAITQLSNAMLDTLEQHLHHWHFAPNGTEGYRTAEVTSGGVDTRYISSKTMQANKVEGLYFIGEVLDVTGWLGGYNFQWAWSSASACAKAIIINNHRLISQ